MKDLLQLRSIEAAKRFCENKGYEILATEWESSSNAKADLVINDAGTLCFVNVVVSDSAGDGFKDGRIERSTWEGIAADWLIKHPEATDIAVRFDTCSMIVLGTRRALIRYHINALAKS